MDEVGITFAIYGEELEPDEISHLLEVTPTSSHRRGDRRGPRSAPYRQGAWFLSVRCEAPVEPDAALTRLLALLPRDENIWTELAGRYDLQLRLGVHFFGWNKGFGLGPATLQYLARMHVKLELDLYAYGDDDEKEVSGDGPDE